MQPSSNSPLPIQLPEIDTDDAVIPIASVAPLDGPPDGERINTFAIAPKTTESPLANFAGMTRHSVRSKPIKSLVVAFSLGYLLARVLR